MKKNNRAQQVDYILSPRYIRIIYIFFCLFFYLYLVKNNTVYAFDQEITLWDTLSEKDKKNLIILKSAIPYYNTILAEVLHDLKETSLKDLTLFELHRLMNLLLELEIETGKNPYFKFPFIKTYKDICTELEYLIGWGPWLQWSLKISLVIVLFSFGLLALSD